MHSHKQRPLSRAVAITLLGSLAFAGNAFGAQALRLLARTTNDEVPAALSTPASGKLATAHLDRAPVAVSWALDATQALDARPQAFTSESREYWIDASESEMQAGLPLALSAAGAVIRISPHGGATRSAIAISDVQLSVAGRRLDNADALRGLASEDELRAAGMDAARECRVAPVRFSPDRQCATRTAERSRQLSRACARTGEHARAQARRGA